jgi:hypothetical protein
MLKSYSRAVGHGEILPKYLFQGGGIYELIKAKPFAALFKRSYFSSITRLLSKGVNHLSKPCIQMLHV